MSGVKEAIGGFLALDEKDDRPVSQVMFFVALGLWMFGRIVLQQTTFASILKPYVSMAILRYACFAILIVRELLFGRWDRRALVGASVAVFMAYMGKMGGFAIITDTVLIVFFGRNMEFRRVAWFFFALLSLFTVVTIVCALFGVIPESAIQSGALTRHRLGFAHPNAAPAHLFFALCLWVCLRGRRINLLDLVVALAVIAPVYYLTHSRTSCWLMAILVVLAFALRWVPEGVLRWPGLRVLGVGSVAICAVAAFTLTAFYDPSIGWMQTLNSFLSGRLQLGHQALMKYGVGFLGQKANMSDALRYSLVTGSAVTKSSSGIVVDCVYVRFAIRCGALFMILAIVLATMANAKACKKGEWWLLLAVGFVAMHGISEACCAYLTYNAFLFLLGGLFYSRRPKPDEIAVLLEADHSDSVIPHSV